MSLEVVDFFEKLSTLNTKVMLFNNAIVYNFEDKAIKSLRQVANSFSNL